MNFVPKVIPINELKNTGNISRICKESNVPIIITKNGYGDMVLMNIEFYESLIEKINTIILLNEAVNDPKREENEQDFEEFMDGLTNERKKK
mgnify:CR=1 FL=1